MRAQYRQKGFTRCGNWKKRKMIYFELYPHLGEKKTKLNLTIISDIYIWQLHLTSISDIYIWQLHLAFISDIYLWRLYLTFLFDIYIWHSKVCWFIRGSPNPLFYRCKFSRRLQTIHLFRKTRTKLAATEATWRLLTSPIVEKKHVRFPYVIQKCVDL